MTAGNGQAQQYRDLRQEQDRAQLLGEWMDADNTDNHLQVGETRLETPEGEPLFAVRSTFNHGRVIYATVDQIDGLCQLRDQLRRTAETRAGHRRIPAGARA